MNRDQDDVRENANKTQADEGNAAAGSHADAESAGPAADIDLDLEGLDLTVETVEERISPSETNVFDK